MFVHNVTANLSTETVQGPPLPLQSIHNIHRGNSLPPSMLSISHSITNNILEESLQNSPSLLIDKTRDTFHTTTTSQTTDSRLGDTLDVVTKDLPVALGTSLSESFSSLSSSRHGLLLLLLWWWWWWWWWCWWKIG